MRMTAPPGGRQAPCVGARPGAGPLEPPGPIFAFRALGFQIFTLPLCCPTPDAALRTPHSALKTPCLSATSSALFLCVAVTELVEHRCE